MSLCYLPCFCICHVALSLAINTRCYGSHLPLNKSVEMWGMWECETDEESCVFSPLLTIRSHLQLRKKKWKIYRTRGQSMFFFLNNNNKYLFIYAIYSLISHIIHYTATRYAPATRFTLRNPCWSARMGVQERSAGMQSRNKGNRWLCSLRVGAAGPRVPRC